jgi:hypothetical protein
MTDIISIDIIDNERGGHEDLIFSIPNLIEQKELDTYYFWISNETIENLSELKIAVSKLIKFWFEKVYELNSYDTIYLPIDFSDQYTGCLRVYKEDNQLILTYGFSMREGWAVDPLNPENYYKSITDFEGDTEKQIKVDKEIFLAALTRQINRLSDS